MYTGASVGERTLIFKDLLIEFDPSGLDIQLIIYCSLTEDPFTIDAPL